MCPRSGGVRRAQRAVDGRSHSVDPLAKVDKEELRDLLGKGWLTHDGMWFVHAAADFVKAIVEGKDAWPNFYDGMKSMQVIEAGIESAQTGRRIDLK